MLTRREKLLNRPWQLRRYNNHRHKVLTALPAIDFGPPAERHHVTCKLKKLQWEGEKRHKIEEENFQLLQRMGSVMKKNRLENHWGTPPPDFLHRVGIYHRTRSPTPYREMIESPEENLIGPSKRRGCSACTPKPKKPPVIPEERVPWSPPRERLSRRRSSSVNIQPQSDFEPRRNVSPKKKSPATSPDVKLGLPSVPHLKIRSKSVNAKSKQLTSEQIFEKRLVLTQGALELSLIFPPFADVKIVSGNENRYIQRSQCECKGLVKVQKEKR